MANLRFVLIWFALGFGIGRFPWQSHGGSDCIRELTSHTMRSVQQVGGQSQYSTSRASTPSQGFGGEVNDFLFNSMIQRAYSIAVETAETARNDFEVNSWDQKSDGGLLDEDRAMLGMIYRRANSVFEYGLGESTRIAHHVGVPRYAGIDSDAAWVSNTRDHVAPHFRFYLADIGETGMWGAPTEKLDKAILNYQLAPLMVEPKPFDVYMVDGRFRFPCMMASFLHASARGETNLTKTVVLVHDCQRAAYHKADHLLSVETSGGALCAFRRLPNTTDEQLYLLWNKHVKSPS